MHIIVHLFIKQTIRLIVLLFERELKHELVIKACHLLPLFSCYNTYLINSMPLLMKLIILTRALCSKLVESISPPLALFLYDPYNYYSPLMTQDIECSVVSDFWYLIIYILTLFIIHLELE